MALNATMRGVVWEGVPFQMTVRTLPVPTIINQTDAIVRITASAICGTDLHTYHGVYGSSNPPWVMGHEGVGVISDVGSAVHSLSVGDRVVIPDMPSDGRLDMGRESIIALGLGTDYGLHGGCQSEYVRVPFADDSLIPIPSTNSTNDLDYLFVSDIFATGWAALDYAGFQPGDTVAVFGAGPVGLLSAYSAILRGASRVYSVDHVPQRLEKAASIGAIPINFRDSDPVQQILRYEPHGVMRSVDCVGFEAVNDQLEIQEDVIVKNMVAVTAMNGGLGQVGVFGPTNDTRGTPRGSTLSPTVQFPISDFFAKGLSFKSGPVDPKLLAPHLVELISSGKAQPGFIVSAEIGIEQVPKYYERFDQHLETKVVIRFP